MKKVLIVEDAPDVRDAMELLVKRRGHAVVGAGDGVEGCRMALEERPDLILMDVSLPEMDGIDATREIRSFPETARTPIVIVSAFTEGREWELLEAGANEVLSKTSFMISCVPTLSKYLER